MCNLRVQDGEFEEILDLSPFNIMDLTDPASALTGEDTNTISEKGWSGFVFLEATALGLLAVKWDKANTMQLLTAKLAVQKKQSLSPRLQALLQQRGNEFKERRHAVCNASEKVHSMEKSHELVVENTQEIHTAPHR